MVRLHAVGFQNIGVDGALGEERHLVAHLAGFLLEHADELGADDLALGLGFGHAGEQVEEAVRGVHVHQVRVELVAEHVHDLLGLALAEQTMVHVNADELLADGFDEQSGDYGAVHTAGEGQQDFLVTDLLAAGSDLLLDKCLGKLRVVMRTMSSGRLLRSMGLLSRTRAMGAMGRLVGGTSYITQHYAFSA